MPDPTPTPKALTATPSSARALAAAGAGETVTLRVAFERQPLWEEEPAMSKVGTWCGRYAEGDEEGNQWVEVDEHEPPVAEGERVAVKCPECGGAGQQALRGDFLYGAHYVPCDPCDSFGMVWATVLATPTPERWCEECEGLGFVLDDELARKEAAEGSVWPSGHRDCPGCQGDAPCRWRVEVRRESDA